MDRGNRAMVLGMFVCIFMENVLFLSELVTLLRCNEYWAVGINELKSLIQIKNGTDFY